MTEHDPRADELEREIDEMQQRTDRLEDEIGDTREDWERRKADPSVPGAVPDDDDRGDDPPPEQQYPAKGD